MIKISIGKNEDGFIVVECNGHANYSEHGTDIVCSAVSALVQAYIGALVNSDIETSHTLEPGHCKVISTLGGLRELRMLAIGLMQIEKAHPENVALTIDMDGVI